MADWIKVAIDFLQLSLAIGAIAFAWFRTRDAKADKRINALEQDVAAVRGEVVVERDERRQAIENERSRRGETHGALKDRMTAIEEHVRHLPTIEHHGDLHRDLNKLEGRVETVVTATNALTEGVRRIEDYLMADARNSKGLI